MVFVLLCVFCLVLILIKYVLHVRHVESYVKNVKSISPRLPLIGNVRFFMGKSVQTVVEDSVQVILQHGTPIKAQIGPVTYVIVDRPEDMQSILTSTHCLDKPYIYDFFYAPTGLINNRSGHTWKPIRKMMNPLFSLERIQSYLPTLNQKTTMILYELDCEVGKPAFDVMHYVSRCTLNAVCSTILGLDLDTNSKSFIYFLDSIKHFYDAIAKRSVNPWFHLEFIYRWSDLYAKQQQHKMIIRKFAHCVFDAKKKAHLDCSTPHDDFDAKTKQNDFPLMQMHMDGEISEESLKEQIVVLLGTGHDSMASAIADVILMLAIHSNIQEQVFQELHSNYDTQYEATTSEKLQNLQLLDRVFKETLRLFPACFTFLRTPNANLELTGCTVPKGVPILLAVYTMHRRRDIWGDDADQFNPDHFLPENTENRPPFSFIPFSSGLRNCIALQYSMVSIKLILSAILRQYKFSTELTMNDVRPRFGVTLKLMNTHMVSVERRNW